MNELEIKRTPEVIGAEIRSLTTQARSITLWYGIEIGRRLTEAKEMVNHGEWLPFLEQQTEFSQPTASRFMRLYKEYGADQNSLFGAESKYATLNNLSISNALRLLALPEEERESFAAENDLENKSAREVEALIKEKTALEQQLKEAKEGQALALAEAMAERDSSQAELHTTAEQLKTARERIRQLEERPTEVAVERDEEAIQTAAASARLEAKLEAEKAADAAIAALNREHAEQLRKEMDKAKEAMAERDKLKEQLAAASATEEKAKLEEEIKALQARISMAAPEVAAFQAAFQRVQQEFNQMLEAMGKAPAESREKLRRAVNAMVDSFCQRVENI